MGMRRKGRELAVQGLYQMEIRKEQASSLEHFWRHAVAELDTKKFGRTLLEGVAEHCAEIDALIEKAASNWRLERLSPVDLSILRLATFELLHRPEIPSSVTLDEAIEIARKFSTGESASFVNGVLDQIVKVVGVKNPPKYEADEDE